MSTFSAAETAACCRLIDLALQEDFGGQPAWRGDITSFALLPSGFTGQALIEARAGGVIAGMPALGLVLGAVSEQLRLTATIMDGTRVEAGQPLAFVAGPLNFMLAAERTALNFVQRLSGIATLTRSYVDAVAGLSCRILDTRKTTPGWRLLEKYAVRCGGGHNHRVGLYDQILIKDNHLAAVQQAKLSIGLAIQKARAERPGSALVPVEVEVDNLAQFDEALAAAPDIILLDNMALEQLREAVRRRQERAPKVVLEASGGVNLQTVRAIAETGVDCISVGALTHSASALDIALDYDLSPSPA
jgi:nicotinate-nucleotide pyrophosphorylase (carboxylating)